MAQTTKTSDKTRDTTKNTISDTTGDTIVEWRVVSEVYKANPRSAVREKRTVQWTDKRVFGSYDEADKARMRLARRHPRRDFSVKRQERPYDDTGSL